MRAPHARYRLYTSGRSYLPCLRDLLQPARAEGAAVHFRRELRAFLGVERVIPVPMCRTGVFLAMRQLIRPGQEVVLSPYTIVDVVNMVIAAGGRPAFADIDRSTCSITAESVEPLLRAETGAVLVTHLHGIAAPIREIEALCSGRGVPVVEDTAQAFGARVEGRRLGTFGDVGVYSFGTYKNLNTWYGGAVTCANPERFAAIRKQVESWTPRSAASLVRQMLKGLSTDVATHPALFRTLTYWIFRFGALHDIRAINRFVQTELDLSRREELPRAYRGQMTPAQQRLGLAQLPHVDRDNAARVEKAARYRRGLEDLGGLVLPPDAASGIYTYFPVQWPGGEAERRRLLRYLTERGCDIGPQHLKNCADLPAFREFARDCPNAREAADAVVLLPTYPRYPNRDVDRNLEVLRAYAAARGV